MAWIEVHQALKRHPKLSDLAAELDIERVHALGHLISFWLDALDYAQDGDTSRFKPVTIAEWGGWTGDPHKFSEALRATGFVDADGAIHDWDEYAGKLLDRRRANRERAKKSREACAQRARTDDEPCAQRAVLPTNTTNTHQPNQQNPPTTARERAREGGISRDGSGAWGCLDKITEAELRDPAALDARLGRAIQAGKWGDSERDRHAWFALAARALRKGDNPPAMFRSLVQDHPDTFDQADEDAASRMMKGRGPPKRERKAYNVNG